LLIAEELRKKLIRVHRGRRGGPTANRAVSSNEAG
jgi:hypothetical protein